MTQHTTVSRFCAIEGIECNKCVPYKGADTFFFAYPSGRHWRDFSLQLATELGQRGVEVNRWEDTVRNDLLFSKVCEGIYGHDYLLAEVTEPNSNVLLEIGYALAVGRQPILLKDNSRTDWHRTLLTTLESCHYDTRDSIHQYIASLQSGDRTIAQEPDRSLPFLENMGIFGDVETPGTVFHLKPKISADWISRVDRILRDSFFKLGTMDPSDSVYDEFYPQAREIQRASLIIASLLSEQHNDWNQHNAHVALLIGFAIGLGKQVLVLQQQPTTPILDLGSVSRPFATESQAASIVESWIRAQTQSHMNQTTQSRARAAVRRRADQIREIYLGHPDALQDTELLKYFVPTKEFEDAIEGRRMIFIGRRGSGKSANFQAIKEALSEKPDTLTIEIAPDDFELEELSSFLDDGYALANPKLLFQSTWNYILITEMLKALAVGSDKLYVSPNDLARTNLYQYYEDHRAKFDMDFGSRVVSMLKGSQESSDLDSANSIQSLRDYHISRYMRTFAEQEKVTFFIVADDLDKHWRPDTQQSIDLLIGLVAESDRLQRFFEGHLKIVMFLREDIFDVLSQYDEDLPKRNYLRMEWTKSNLKHLVAERLSTGTDHDNHDDSDTWSMIFPEDLDGVTAADYILSRVLLRPRDVLGLCQSSIDQAQRNGHSAVYAADILDGESAFADYFMRSVSAEFRGLYPKLEEVLIEFAGVPSTMHWEDFRTYANEAIRIHKDVIGGWIGISRLDIESLADVLFRVGVIGLSISSSEDPHYRNGRSFAETWKLVSPAPAVHIHPGVRQSSRCFALGPGATPCRKTTKCKEY